MRYNFIRNKKKMNKKGQITQVVLFMVIIFVVGITVLFGKLILSEFYDAISGTDIETVKGSEAQASLEANYAVFDYGLIVLTVVLFIGMIITSFMIPSHPIFMVVNIIGIFMLVFIGMILTNVYGELVAGDTSVLEEQANEFVSINFLISKLPYIGAIVIFVTSIVMYARGSGGIRY